MTTQQHNSKSWIESFVSVLCCMRVFVFIIRVGCLSARILFSDSDPITENLFPIRSDADLFFNFFIRFRSDRSRTPIGSEFFRADPISSFLSLKKNCKFRPKPSVWFCKMKIRLFIAYSEVIEKLYYYYNV